MEKQRLKKIFQKTDGCCHICYKKLSFSSYGKHGTKRAWHVEHSKAKARGGSDHLNNLFAACISCNLEKGTKLTKAARAKNGWTRAPLSKEKKKRIREENTIAGGIIGGLLGSLTGPAGLLLGAGIGASIGSSNIPKK